MYALEDGEDLHALDGVRGAVVAQDDELLQSSVTRALDTVHTSHSCSIQQRETVTHITCRIQQLVTHAQGTIHSSQYDRTS